jgi:hypothetical protein
MGSAAGFAWPFVHNWGSGSDGWGWLAALYGIGWLAAVASLALVAFGAGRRSLIWSVIAIFAADIFVLFVWFLVGASHGALS